MASAWVLFIGAGASHFYGYRVVEALGCDPETGVLRVSFVHYTSPEEIDKLIKALDLAGDCQIWMVGSVREEDCDGLCWHYILSEGLLRPDLVVLTEGPSTRHPDRNNRMEIIDLRRD